jgi:hypothetical protein
MWLKAIRGSDQVARRAAGVYFLVAQILVQNDQPSIVHDMSVFVSDQLPDFSRQHARKHNARRFDGLPARTRAYQVINSLAMVLKTDGHDELLVFGQPLASRGLWTASVGTAARLDLR